MRRAISSPPTLSDEQQRLIRRLRLDGACVAVIAGKAGTGKTFALAAAREAWRAAGYPVLGAAVARRAARELQDGAGIESMSVAVISVSSIGGTACPSWPWWSSTGRGCSRQARLLSSSTGST